MYKRKGACAFQNQHLEDPFYPSEYMGRWYQIARIPQWFDRGCPKATADYQLLANGSVSVLNRCVDESGNEIRQVSGIATPDPSCPAALRVEFPGFPPGPSGPNYLVLSTDYENYALVGTPDKSALWVLSRTPTMGKHTYNQMLCKAVARGYNVKKLVVDPPGITDTRGRICKF